MKKPEKIICNEALVSKELCNKNCKVYKSCWGGENESIYGYNQCLGEVKAYMPSVEEIKKIILKVEPFVCGSTDIAKAIHKRIKI